MSIVFLHFVTCDYKSNQKRYYRSPLVLNKWSPIRQNGYRNPGLFVQLRPAGSNNIISRVPSPAYFKTDLSLRSRFNKSPIKTMLYQSSQKNINKNGQMQQHMISGIRPNAFAFKENQQKNNNFIHMTRPTKPTKPVTNTFVIAPITVMKPIEYIYENFNLQVNSYFISFHFAFQ